MYIGGRSRNTKRNNTNRNDKKKDIFSSIQNNVFVELLTPYSEFINTEHLEKTNSLKFKCKHCNTEYYGNWFDDKPTLCRKCYPKENKISNQEKEVYSFVKSTLLEYYPDIEVIENAKDVISPLELDIYIPKKNIAIEFDGLFWHSLSNKHKYYHYNKTKKCEKLGIHLIHIFENEWIYSKEIVKSRICNILGITKNITTIYARNCEIREIDSKTSIEFQKENHLQDTVKNCKINIGLFYKNKMVANKCVECW